MKYGLNQKSIEELQEEKRQAEQDLAITRIQMNELVTAYSGLFEESGTIRQKIINADRRTRKVQQKTTSFGTRWVLDAVNECCADICTGTESPLTGEDCLVSSLLPTVSLGDRSVAVQIHVEEGMEHLYLEALRNLPFSYDLYLTCDSDVDPEKLCQMYADSDLVHDICATVLPEGVHSYAGIYAIYREEIQSHTFLLHFGGSKCNCIDTTPRDLLVDEATVRRFLTLLSQDGGVSLLFTEAFSAVTSSDEMNPLFGDYGVFKGYGKKYYSYPIADSFWMTTELLQEMPVFGLDDFRNLSEVQVKDFGRKLIAKCMTEQKDFGIYDPAQNQICYRFSDHYFQHCKSESIKTLGKMCGEADCVVFDLDGALMNINANGTKFLPRRDMTELFHDLQKEKEKRIFIRCNSQAFKATGEVLDALKKYDIEVSADQLLSGNSKREDLPLNESVLLIGTMDCANRYQEQLQEENRSGKITGSGRKTEYYPVPSFEMQINRAGFRRNKADFDIYAGILFNSPFALNGVNLVRNKLQNRFHDYRRAIQPIYVWQRVREELAKNPHQMVILSGKDAILEETGRRIHMDALTLEPGALRLAACFDRNDIYRLFGYRYAGTMGDFMEDLFHMPASVELKDVPINLPDQRERVIRFMAPYTGEMLRQAKEVRNRLRTVFSGCPAGVENLLLISPEFQDENVLRGLATVTEYRPVMLSDTAETKLDPGIVADLSSVLQMNSAGKKELRDFWKCVDAVLESGVTVRTTDLYLTQEIDQHMAAENVQHASASETIDYDRWYRLVKPSSEELSRQRKTTFQIRPKFSIVIPVFRTREKLLRLLLDSILHQTYQNFEICIADASDYDRMNDDTKDGKLPRKVLAEYAQKDSRVRFRVLDGNYGISENTNKAIDMATGDFIVFADHDDELTPDALFECTKVINERPYVQMIYSDEDKTDEYSDKYLEPHFKPDFSPELLLCVNYICHLMVFRRSLLNQIAEKDAQGGLHYERKEFDGAQDYDLILRAAESAFEKEQQDLKAGVEPLKIDQEKQLKVALYTSLYIRHIPKVLYHWRVYDLSTSRNGEAKPYTVNAGRRALEASYQRRHISVEKIEDGISPGVFHAVYRNSDPLVSVIIPNKDHVRDLDLAIRSLLKGTYRNLEIIVVENNSTEKLTWSYYERIQKEIPSVRVIEYKGGFNYSKINNFGVKAAKGEYLLFLNNDTEMIEPDSIAEMVGQCQKLDVGIVGVKLLYQDDSIQHAGVIVGILGIAGHCFQRQMGGTYFNRAEYAENYSAVTAACMMSKRTVFDEVGGFTEDLAVAFNDIDYCMKVRTRGYRVVYEPYASFHHYESKSRGLDTDPVKVKRFRGEILFFHKRWKDFLSAGDPYYNPNQTLIKQDFSLRDLTKEEIGKPYYMFLVDGIDNDDQQSGSESDEQKSADHS